MSEEYRRADGGATRHQFLRWVKDSSFGVCPGPQGFIYSIQQVFVWKLSL
jgi:hypothetical protein